MIKYYSVIILAFRNGIVWYIKLKSIVWHKMGKMSKNQINVRFDDGITFGVW